MNMAAIAQKITIRAGITSSAGTALVSHEYTAHDDHSVASSAAPCNIPTHVRWSARKPVTWVRAKTKTRSKNSSRGVTRCSTGSPPSVTIRAAPVVLIRCPTFLLDCRLRADQEAQSDRRRGASPLADPRGELDEGLLRCGVLKRPCVERFVACISVQLLDDLPRLLVAAPHIARCRASFVNLLVERGEVGVKRLRRRTVRPRLHVFGVRGEACRGVDAPEVRRIDNRLALEALHIVEGLGDRAARDRHEHDLSLRDVAALSPDPSHVVARPLPEIREPAPDVSSANDCNLHLTLSSLQLLAQLAEHVIVTGLDSGPYHTCTHLPRRPLPLGRWVNKGQGED